MRHRPFPEIVTGERDWEVYEDTKQPRTDMTNRKMYVPLDDECHKCGINHGRVIRRHELGHVKWSPRSFGKIPKGVHEEAIHLLEEVRVNHRLTSAGIPMDKPHTCIEDVRAFTRQLVEKGSVTDIIKYGLASVFLIKKENYLGTYRTKYTHMNFDIWGYEYGAFIQAIKDEIESHTLKHSRVADLEFAMSKISYFHLRMIHTSTKSYTITHKPAWARVKKLAVELSELFDLFNDKPTEDVRLSDEDEAKLKEAVQDEDVSNIEEAYDKAELTQPGNVSMLKQRNKSEANEILFEYDESKATWADYTTHKPALTINMSNKIRTGYTNVAKDRGVAPRKIHRYTIDKKIFSRKQNVYGGTILIDASGSMNFNGQDILDIMNEVPAVTIAMYNYYGWGNTSGKGDIRIIARNGRRVHDDYLNEHSGGGNWIDLPALQWLGKQAPRRLWVSDMKVVGRNGTGKENLKQCLDACNKYNIMRLADVDEVKSFARQLNVVR